MAVPTITTSTDTYSTTTTLNAVINPATFTTTTTTTTTSTSPASTTATSTTTNTKDSRHQRRTAIGSPRIFTTESKLSNLALMKDDAPASPPLSPHPVIPKSPRSLKQKPSQINLQNAVADSEIKHVVEKDKDEKTVESEYPALLSPRIIDNSEPHFFIRRFSVAIPKNGKKNNDTSDNTKQPSQATSPRQLVSGKSTEVHVNPEHSTISSYASALQSTCMSEVKGLAAQMVREFIADNSHKILKNGQLLQNHFHPRIKNTSSWEKFKDSYNQVLQTKISDHTINNYSDDSKKQLQLMMRPFADNSISCIMGDRLDSSPLPNELIVFLLHADHLLLEVYLVRSSVKVMDINAARIGLFKDLLLKNIIIPLLFDSNIKNKSTLAENFYQTELFKSLINSFRQLSSEFLTQSYETMPTLLKEKLNKAVQNEINKEENDRKLKNIDVVKSRISNFQSKKSSRSLLVNDEKKPISNVLEEKARAKYLLKNNIDNIFKLLEKFGVNELKNNFQDSLHDELKKLAESPEKLEDFAILKCISEHNQIYMYAENYSGLETDADVIEFSKKIEISLNIDMETQTKRRATMYVKPLNLDELDELDYLMGKTIDAGEGNTSATLPVPDNSDDTPGNQISTKTDNDIAESEKDKQ